LLRISARCSTSSRKHATSSLPPKLPPSLPRRRFLSSNAFPAGGRATRSVRPAAVGLRAPGRVCATAPWVGPRALLPRAADLRSPCHTVRLLLGARGSAELREELIARGVLVPRALRERLPDCGEVVEDCVRLLGVPAGVARRNECLRWTGRGCGDGAHCFDHDSAVAAISASSAPRFVTGHSCSCPSAYARERQLSELNTS